MSKTYTKISTLTKVLAILNIIGSSPVPVIARDIAEQADVTYATAMNNIVTLEDAGFIEKQGSGRAVAEHKQRGIYFRSCVFCQIQVWI